jgi:microsomal dipeptidase-like Zn-dependent dipeptidase
MTPYVVDLHAHFPMQFDPASQDYRRPKRWRRHRGRQSREKLCDRLRFMALQIADFLFNRDELGDGHAVTLATLTEGHVGVALSVAYTPFQELDLPYASPPEDGYFEELRNLLRVVEAEVAADAEERARVVKSFAELEQARADGKVALIHAVEGGFHLGGTDAGIRKHVAELGALGVGYVTVAHLFWRQLATNVAALPFMSDGLYHKLFPQEPVGLDELGRTVLREMVRHGILIDVTHMSERSMADTFALLDAIDPEGDVPLIASHVACSFGKYEYNLKKEWVERIAARGGVCGIIYCDHYMRDGRGKKTEDFEQSFAVIEGQIARLREWGGDGVLAIGSDFDGFIKPTLEGLDSAADHKKLADRLVARYGEPLAAKITHENAMRVFRQAWMKPVDLG